MRINGPVLSFGLLLATHALAAPITYQWTTAGGTVPPVPTSIQAMSYGVLGNTLYLTSGVQGGSPGAATFAWPAGAPSWTAAASSPAGSCVGVNPAFVGPASAVGNGLFWRLGGWGGCPGVAADDVASYDPVMDCWNGACVPPPAPANPCLGSPAAGYASGTVGDVVYTLGGLLTSSMMVHHNTGFDLVARAPVPGNAVPPDLPRAFGAAVGHDGQVFYMGGQFLFNCGGIINDPCTAPVMIGGGGGGTVRSFIPACCVTCGPGCCGGGTDCDTLGCCDFLMPCGVCTPSLGCTARMDAYDPVTDSWTAKAPMPVPLTGHTAVLHDNKIYVFGGVDSCLSWNLDTLVYSPICDQWIVIPTNDPLPAFLAGRVLQAGGVLDAGGGASIYRAGGIENFIGGGTTSMEVLTPTPASVGLAPGVQITAPAPSTIVCGCVDLDYQVTDGDDVMVSATWAWSSNGGVTWNLCTECAPAGANPRGVPATAGGASGTFTWDAMADVGVGAQPVLVGMCVTDTTELAEDRIALTVECVVPCTCSLAGDCDESGGVTILDSLTALRFAAGLLTLSPTGHGNCNVHQALATDVTSLDGLQIARYVVGLLPSLACCP